MGKLGSRRKTTNIEGKKFGRLLVLREVEKGNKNRDQWLCQCDCGKLTTKLGVNLRKAKSAVKSCGCAYIKINPEERGLKELIRDYSRKDRRNYCWELTNEEARTLFFSNCFYCNAPPDRELIASESNRLLLKYNGIDRFDNSRDYTVNNAVPCCTICNRGKNDASVTKALEWFISIAGNI